MIYIREAKNNANSGAYGQDALIRTLIRDWF